MSRSPKTLSSPLAKIENRLAELNARLNEIHADIEQMRSTVVRHKLAPEDIFPDGWPDFDEGVAAGSGTRKAPVARARKATKPRASPSIVLYRNANGQEWTGKGRRPNWLNEALEAGATLADFRV